MKRLLIAIGSALCLLVAVLLIRAVRYGVPARPARIVQAGGPDSAVFPPDSAVLAHLAAAVRIPTVTYADSSPRIAQFERLHDVLRASFPLVHAKLQREVIDSAGLLFTWRGTDTTLRPLVLMGHMDVVPIEPGTETKWTHGPFSGELAGGAVWGRGTLDDKSAVTGTLEAVESLLRSGFTPRRTVMLSYGYTEEGGGPSMKKYIAMLESRGIHPQMVLDEGGFVTDGVIKGVSGQIALVATAEKGFLDLRLTAHGVGGHSSTPPRETSVGILAVAITKLERSPMPARLDGPSLSMMETVGHYMPLGRRVIMANLWLFKPVLMSVLSKTPATDAAIRTTTAPTMIQGSPKDNVLPSAAVATVNFRLLPGDSPARVIRHVRDVIHDARVSIDTVPGLAVPASPESPSDGPEYAALRQTIEETFPGAVVSPFLTIAATDARYFTGLTPNVFRFLPIVVTQGDIERVHGTDERVFAKDYLRGVRFYRRLIERAAQ